MTKPRSVVLGDKVPQKARKKPITRQIREALLNGEKMDRNEAQKRFGGAPNLIIQAVKVLEKGGCTIKREKQGRNTYYSVDIFPSQSKVADKPEKIEPTPMPILLEQLEVSAIAVDRKGRLGMTLRNSKHSWRVIIEGVASK